MTVSIQLSDEQIAMLNARAKELGLSAEKYAQQILQKELAAEPEIGSSRPARRISQVIADIMAATPQEELAKLPKDGASEHDHYIYGWPKRNS